MRDDHIKRRELAALADIVSMHLSVDADERLSCREIGRLLGMSHESIRIIEMRAVAKMRQLVKEVM